MANNISVPCTETCSVSAECPVKAIGNMKPIDQNKAPEVITMLATRDKVHGVLASMAQDSHHGSEIQALLDAGCDGSHSHNHGCDSHELGHHGEVVELEGRNEHICDVDSLQTLADQIGQILSDCGEEDKHDHSGLRASLSNLRSYISEMKQVSACTKQMCKHVTRISAPKRKRIQVGEL